MGFYGKEASDSDYVADLIVELAVGDVGMSFKSSLSTFLASAGLISTLGVLSSAASAADTPSASRCVADLARIKTDFCVSASHIAFGSAPASPLEYTWSLNDDRFDLNAKACLSSSGAAGERQDLVIALDRSRSMWVVDGTNAKNGTVSIASSKILIDAVQEEAKQNPDRAAKIGVMLFSTDESCDEYTGGSIVVDRVFPCLYVPAASAADAEHIKKLNSFLAAAEGKYSQGGLDRGSDYGIVASVLRTNLLELDQAKRSGLVLISDGRTYAGKANDIFAYLRSGSYNLAQGEALTRFAAREMRQFKMVFGLASITELFAGPIHKEEYQNMCTLPEAASADCEMPVDRIRPETWPVNNQNLKAFAQNLVAKTGAPASHVIELTTKDKIRGALDILRFSAEDLLTLESATWSTDGTSSRPAVLTDGSLQLPAIEFASILNLELLLRAGAREVLVPMKISLTQVAAGSSRLVSGEMVCELGAAGAPRLSLKNMQGGSASCAVVGSEGPYNKIVLVLILLAPLLFIAWNAKRAKTVMKVAILLTSAAIGLTSHSAEILAQDGGLNVLQYRPVVDGNGSSETANPTPKGTYNAALFLDYANDALELGIEKNQRSTSVVDDLVTTHFVANYGVVEAFSLGVHAPLVANASIDRATEDSSNPPRDATAISDIALFAKISLLGRAKYNLGLMPLVTLPTGNTNTLTGDGSSNYGMSLLVSHDDSLISWSANFGYLQREKAIEVEDTRARPLTIRGQYLLNLGATWRATTSISAALNFQLKVSAGEKLDFTNSNPSEWGVTTKYKLSQKTVLSGMIGTGIGKGYGSPDYRMVAGIAYIPAAQRYSSQPKAQMSQNPASKKPKSR